MWALVQDVCSMQEAWFWGKSRKLEIQAYLESSCIHCFCVAVIEYLTKTKTKNNLEDKSVYFGI